jgi:hypothetical protein
MPATLDDPPNAGLPYRAAQERADGRAAVMARDVLDLALAAGRRSGVFADVNRSAAPGE